MYQVTEKWIITFLMVQRAIPNLLKSIHQKCGISLLSTTLHSEVTPQTSNTLTFTVHAVCLCIHSAIAIGTCNAQAATTAIASAVLYF